MGKSIKWDELPADERNRLVAEKVMGWQAKECDGSMGEQPCSPDGWFCQKCGVEGNWGDGYAHEEQPRRYTQSMERAWEVIQMLHGRLLFSGRRQFFKELQRLTTDTLDLQAGLLIDWPDALWYLTPEIICKAALKACGVEIE